MWRDIADVSFLYKLGNNIISYSPFIKPNPSAYPNMITTSVWLIVLEHTALIILKTIL